MSIWKLSLRLQEPVTCAEKPLTGNQTPTLPYIPATTLRGALAQALAWEDRRADIPRWFGGPAPRWSHAWPTPPGGMVVPVPRSFLSDKGDDGFRQDSQFGIYNTLDPDLPVQTKRHRHEWKAYRESLMVLAHVCAFAS
jgi:CRISPR/Cas system CMR subunit Cmr6 (Cas7 group RAMP superfamily)